MPSLNNDADNRKTNGDGWQHCRRCGTCCLKGGPALHIQDKDTIIEGRIPLSALFTIREGELAYDNIRKRISPAATDIIKIKNARQSTACIHYDRLAGACTIYDARPYECRLLKCWQTEDIEGVYDKDRLVREDVLVNIDGLWEMVREHHSRCSYSLLMSLADRIRQEDIPQSQEKVLELVRYDDALRERVLQKSRVEPDVLLFLFGRPLRQTIAMLGLKLQPDGRSISCGPS